MLFLLTKICKRKEEVPLCSQLSVLWYNDPNKNYTGHNLLQRIEQLMSDNGCSYAKTRTPFQLIYSENCKIKKRLYSMNR